MGGESWKKTDEQKSSVGQAAAHSYKQHADLTIQYPLSASKAWFNRDRPPKKNDSRFSRHPQTTFVYVQVTAPSSDRNNDDGSKAGSQVMLWDTGTEVTT